MCLWNGRQPVPTQNEDTVSGYVFNALSHSAPKQSSSLSNPGPNPIQHALHPAVEGSHKDLLKTREQIFPYLRVVLWLHGG